MGYLENTNNAFLFSFQLNKHIHYNLKHRNWETDNCCDYGLKNRFTVFPTGDSASVKFLPTEIWTECGQRANGPQSEEKQ